MLPLTSKITILYYTCSSYRGEGVSSHNGLTGNVAYTTHTHTYIHTCTHTHMHTHTHTHAHTHAHTHIHICTHTHTHTHRCEDYLPWTIQLPIPPQYKCHALVFHWSPCSRYVLCHHRFLKRLCNFYKPSNHLYSSISYSEENSCRYSHVGQELVKYFCQVEVCVILTSDLWRL